MDTLLYDTTTYISHAIYLDLHFLLYLVHHNMFFYYPLWLNLTIYDILQSSVSPRCFFCVFSDPFMQVALSVYNPYTTKVWSNINTYITHSLEYLLYKIEVNTTHPKKWWIWKKNYIDPVNYYSWYFLYKLGKGKIEQKQYIINLIGKIVWYKMAP